MGFGGLRPARSGWAQELSDAPGDRGGWVEELDRPGGELVHAVEQKRVMGAGEDHGVGPRTVLFHEAGRDLACDVGVGDRLVPERGFGNFSKPR